MSRATHKLVCRNTFISFENCCSENSRALARARSEEPPLTSRKCVDETALLQLLRLNGSLEVPDLSADLSTSSGSDAGDSCDEPPSSDADMILELRSLQDRLRQVVNKSPPTDTCQPYNACMDALVQGSKTVEVLVDKETCSHRALTPLRKRATVNIRASPSRKVCSRTMRSLPVGTSRHRR